MKRLQISQTIYLLLGFSLLVGGVAATFLAVRCLQISNAYNTILNGEVAQAQQVRVLQVAFKKQVQAWKDILLRGKDDASLAKYDKEFHALSAAVQSKGQDLRSHVADPEASAGLGSFLDEHQTLNGQYEAALSAYKAGRDFAAADTMVKGKDRPPTDALDKVTERLTSLADAVPLAEAARLKSQQLWLSGMLLVVFVGLGAWSFHFAHALHQRLQQSMEFVQTMAGGDLTALPLAIQGDDELDHLIESMSLMREELSRMVASIQSVSASLTVSADGVSQTTSQLARTLSDERQHVTQVAAALEEMISSVHEVDQHCEMAAERAAQTGELATGSCATVDGVAGEVRALASEAQTNARHVQELGERSSRIGQVVTLIEEIAGQTNLLALNAAIESARAGEHGRGFAVVAGEVRRLAERTTTATKEIASAVQLIQQGTSDAVQSIQGSTESVARSVATADEAAKSLGALGVSAHEVRERIRSIVQSTQQQSIASRQVGSSMNEITSGIATTTDGVEELAHAARQMTELAHKLDAQAGLFHVNTSR